MSHPVFGDITRMAWISIKIKFGITEIRVNNVLENEKQKRLIQCYGSTCAHPCCVLSFVLKTDKKTNNRVLINVPTSR